VSDYDRTEGNGFRQLEALVRALGEELASFRRRAQHAEARVRSLEASAATGTNPASREDLQHLEAENEALRARLVHITARMRRLMARVRFLRQQQHQEHASHAGAKGTSA
jgi:chromosome segregation ATPase